MRKNWGNEYHQPIRFVSDENIRKWREPEKQKCDKNNMNRLFLFCIWFRCQNM